MGAIALPMPSEGVDALRYAHQIADLGDVFEVGSLSEFGDGFAVGSVFEDDEGDFLALSAGKGDGEDDEDGEDTESVSSLLPGLRSPVFEREGMRGEMVKGMEIWGCG